MLAIVLSAILLSIRYAALMANPNSTFINKKVLKIAPHVVDTILLLTGVALVIMMGFVPFSAGSEWFTEKVTCILAYFALGFFSIRMAKNRLLRTFAFFGALGWMLMAGKIAMTKMPALVG